MVDIQLICSFHWYLAVIFNPGGMLIERPADPTTASSSTEKLETSPERNGTIDANDENAIDTELGSAPGDSIPDVADTTTVIPDEPMDVDEPNAADESVDELDCIPRSPRAPVKKMKDLEIESKEAEAPRPIKRPVPAGREISDPTLDAVKFQRENHASSGQNEKPPSKSEAVKPVAVKAERPPDHVILNSQQ